MRKTLAAAFAAVLAVLAVFAPRLPYEPLPFHERQFGPEARLPLQVVGLGIEELRFHPLFRFPITRPGQANAVLVDEVRGLYLTAAHVLPPPGSSFFLLHRDGTQFRIKRAWTDFTADLSVILAGPESVPEGARAATLAQGPPWAGEVLVMKGYHVLKFPKQSGEIVLHGFEKNFRVLLPATDACVTPILCWQVAILRSQEERGRVLFRPIELNLLYPDSIYAEYEGPALRGVVGGLSGSPLYNADGEVTAIVSGHPAEDKAGRRGLFSPAYAARRLLATARGENDGS